jgi:hypothetical protein
MPDTLQLQTVVGLHAQHQLHAALQVEAKLDLLLRRIKRKHCQRHDADNQQHLPT